MAQRGAPTPRRDAGVGRRLSCANGSDCWAVGLAPDRFLAAVARTTDGGRVWTSESIPGLETAMSSPFGIACASTADCIVTGEGSLTTTNGGKTWARHATPDTGCRSAR